MIQAVRKRYILVIQAVRKRYGRADLLVLTINLVLENPGKCISILFVISEDFKTVQFIPVQATCDDR